MEEENTQLLPDCDIKDVTVLQFLNSLRPALPLSKERRDDDGRFVEVSNSEIRRWCRDNSVVLNGKRVKHDDIVDFPVTSLVLFPKSQKNRCTLF